MASKKDNIPLIGVIAMGIFGWVVGARIGAFWGATSSDCQRMLSKGSSLGSGGSFPGSSFPGSSFPDR